MNARPNSNSINSRQTRLIIAGLLLASWGAYLLASLPLVFKDGATGWLLPCIAAIGLAAGIMALAGTAYWVIAMRISASLIVLVYVLLWVGYAMTLSEAPPHESFLTSIYEVAIAKFRLVRYIAENTGWLDSTRQAIWELSPVVQAAIVGLHAMLKRRPEQ